MRQPGRERPGQGRWTAGLLTAALLSGCGPPPEDLAAETARDPNAPGVFEVGPNRYEAVVVAFEGGFDPSEMRFPVGA